MKDCAQFLRVIRRLTSRTKTLVSVLTISLLITIFVPVAYAQTYSVIHQFSGIDGSHPKAGVTIRAGNLWGTTFSGADAGAGTVYELMRVGDNWKLVNITQFSGGVGNPQSRIIFGPDSHPYGAGLQWGDNTGFVFDLLPPITVCRTANCFWTGNLIHGFTGFPDGANPGYGDLLWDQQGNIYGTTIIGGTKELGIV